MSNGDKELFLGQGPSVHTNPPPGVGVVLSPEEANQYTLEGTTSASAPSASAPSLSGASERLTGQEVAAPEMDSRIPLDLDTLAKEGITPYDIIRSRTIQEQVRKTPGLGYDIPLLLERGEVSDDDIFRRIVKTRSGMVVDGRYVQTQTPADILLEQAGRGATRTIPALLGGWAGGKAGLLAGAFFPPAMPYTTITGFLLGTVGGAIGGSELEKGLFPTLPYDPTLVDPGVATGAQIFGEGVGYFGAPYLLARKPFDMGARHLMEVWGNSSSRVLRGTAKGTNVLEGFIRGAGEMTAKRPVTAGIAEFSAISGSGLYGGLAEKGFPGDLAARFTGEVVGSFLSPFSVVGNGGLAVFDGIKHLIRTAGPGGRITNSGAKLIKMMESIEPVVDADGQVVRDFSNPEEWIKALEEENFIGRLFEELGVDDPAKLDVATTLPPEAAAIVVQARKTLARQMEDPKKVKAAVDGIKNDLWKIQALLNLMSGSSDPSVLAARARLQEEAFRGQLEADYHLRLVDAAEASDRLLRPGGKPEGQVPTALEEFPTAGVSKARVLSDEAARKAGENIKSAVEGSRASWRKQERKLFDKASTLAAESGVTVRANNTYDAVDELIEQGVPVGSGIPRSVSSLVERLRPDVSETAAALEATVKEGGNLALKGKTPTYIKFREIVGKRQKTVNDANKITKSTSATVTRLQGDVDELEAHQGGAFIQARQQIGLALAESLEGTTAASVKALTTRNDVQDWRAFSKDSRSDEANAAANAGWANFNDLRTKGWGQGQKQDNALKRSIAALQRISSEAGGKGTGSFSVTGGTWARDYGYDDAGAGIRSATKELANKQIALLKGQRKLLAAQKRSTNLQADPPKTVVQAQKQLDELKADIAANKQAQLDFRSAPVDRPDTVPELSVMEMQRIRSDILKHVRAARADIAINANEARALGKLERALLDDMAETANGGLSGVGPEASEASKKAWEALQEGVALSRAGNDLFTRAFKIRELTKRDKYGAEVLLPEQYQDVFLKASPSETGLMMSSISRAAVGIIEGSDAMARGDRFKTVRAAQVSLIRALASRVVNSETGLVNEGDTAEFLVEHATLLDNFFPNIKDDMESAQMAKARFADAQDPDSALTKEQVKSLAFADFLGADTNPSEVVANNLEGKDGIGWLRRTIRGVKETGDPEVAEGLVQGIFDSAWNHAGGNSRDPMSFKAFRDYLYSPLGGRRGGQSPIQMLISEGLITDTQRIRLDKLMSTSVKTEAEIIQYVDKFEQLMSTGVNLENLTGEEIVKQLELLPRRAMDPAIILGDTAQEAGRATARRIMDEKEVMLDNPGLWARLMIRITGSRMGAAISEGVKKVLGIKGEGAQLQAAAAGAQALETAVNRTPLSAYQNIIWEALNDRELFKSLIERGMSARDKYRISRNFIAALGAAGITAADPDPDVYRDEDQETRREMYRSFSPGRSSRPRDPYSSTFTPPGTIRQAEGDKPFPGLLAPAPQQNVAPSPVNLPPAPAAAPNAQQRQRFKSLFPGDFGMDLVPDPSSQPAAQQPAAPPRFQGGFASGGPVKRKRPGILGLA